MNDLSAQSHFRPSLPRTAACRADSAWRRRGRGFSLVEVVVVIVIMAVTSSVAILRYSSSLRRYRVELAAQRLAADLALVQSRARATGRIRTIRISASADTYVLVDESGVTRGSTSHRVGLNSEPFLVTIEDVRLDAGGNTLAFDGYGVPNTNLEVQLAAGDQRRAVFVEAATGRIHVEPR